MKPRFSAQDLIDCMTTYDLTYGIGAHADAQRIIGAFITPLVAQPPRDDQMRVLFDAYVDWSEAHDWAASETAFDDHKGRIAFRGADEKRALLKTTAAEIVNGWGVEAA